MPESMTLAFAGDGPTTYDNVADLLNDWLGFGEQDDDGRYAPAEREVVMILPAVESMLGAGLMHVYDWSARADVEYTAISDGGGASGNAEEVLKEATAVVEADDVALALVQELADAEGDKALVLLNGADPVTDPDNARLVRLAEEHGVRVFDLCLGLAEGLRVEDAKPDAADKTAAAGAVEQAPAAPAGHAVMIELDVYNEALEALAGAAEFLTLSDGIQAAKQLRLIEYGPLTSKVVQARRRLHDGLLPAAGTVPEPDTPAAEVAVPSKKAKTRREFKDPATGQWRPAGPGKPRKDYEYRTVPVGA